MIWYKPRFGKRSAAANGRGGTVPSLAHAYQEIQKKLQEREQEVNEQEKSMAVVQEKIHAMTAALRKAEAKMEGLQNENRVLAQEKAAIEGQFKPLQSL